MTGRVKVWMRFSPFAAAFLAVAAATFFSLQFTHSTIDAVAATMYLLIIVIASRYGLRVAIFAAALTSFAWSYYFVPLIGSFDVSADQVLPLVIFFLVAAGTAVLTSAVRRQIEEAEASERETATLYRLTLAVLSHAHLEDSLEALADDVKETCGASCAFFLPGSDDGMQKVGDASGIEEASLREALTAEDLLASDGGVMVPLKVDGTAIGLMAVVAQPGEKFDVRQHETLLRAVANHGTLAIQRSRLEQAAGKALGQLEAERLKASLLASVSHDLRTPLASIKAAATDIAMDDVKADEATTRVLVGSIISNVDRLDRLVGNLLNMSRLEAGAWQPSKELYPFSEILATVLSRLTEKEAARFKLDLPEDLPMIPVDGQQIEQVLWNLVENAIKFSPPGSPLELTVAETPPDAQDQNSSGHLSVSLRDHGSGIPAGEEARIFQKFYRAHRGGERGAPGVGVGLAICREIVEAHGGRIQASNAPDGGAVFTFTLPPEEENAS